MGITSPGSPQNLVATPDYSSALLSWNTPSSDGGSQITDYIPYWKESTSNIWLPYYYKLPAGQRSVLITNLTPGLTYDFRLQAKNDIGYGTFAYDTKTIVLDASILFDGDGTPDDPYQISTCENLQDIKYVPANSFALTNDIDCSTTNPNNPDFDVNGIWGDSKGFDPIGIFTGEYLDGYNFTINNIYINRSNIFVGGLIQMVNYNSTIKNFSLKGGEMNFNKDNTTTLGGVGTIAGGFLGTLDNVHSSVNIYTNNIDGVGGLVSSIGDPALINQSSYSGNIFASGEILTYVGGLVGSMSYGNIANSYSIGDITIDPSISSQYFCGGFTGVAYFEQISKSYSAGNISCPQGYATGGFAGFSSNGNISDSFSATALIDTPSIYKSSFIGSSNVDTLNSDYFDASLSQSEDCSYSQPDICIGVNRYLSQPTYFKNNIVSAPLSSWNFTNIWIRDISYPKLKFSPTAPGAPSNLRGTNSPGSIDLTWDSPTIDGGSGITDYEIQFKQSASDVWNTFDDGIRPETGATVTGLDTGESYELRVRALNIIGNGLWSPTQLQLPIVATIEEPNTTQFDVDQSINYKVIVDNQSSESIDNFDTEFVANGFVVDDITVEVPETGTAPSNLGYLTNNEEWSGLLEPNQKVVFSVQGTVDGSPGEQGGLSFVASSFSNQGNDVSLRDGSKNIRTASPRFEILNSQTDFSLVTTMSEQGIISTGDIVHLKYTISNLGPKTGFFNNSAAYIFFPPQLNILSIENDLLFCSAPVSITNNTNAGIYSNLSGDSVSLCSAGNSALLQNGDSFDIDVVATASTNFIKNDIISKGILIAEQDIDNVALNAALSAQESNSNSIFESSINNISILKYTASNNTTQPVTTIPQIPTTRVSETPSSNEKTTGSKASSTTPKTKIVNKGQIVGVNKAKNSTISDSGSYEGLHDVKALMKSLGDIDKENRKALALSDFKTKEDSSFSLLWLMILVTVILIAITIRQAQQNSKSKKMLSPESSNFKDYNI